MKERTFDPERLAEEIDQLEGHARVVRRQSLDGLRTLQSAVGALLRNESHRLRRKLGDEHPRVQGAEEGRAHQREMMQEVEAALAVTRIDVPEADEGEMLIHGRITDTSQRGIQNLVVELEDDRGRRITRLDAVETGPSGYYAIVVDEKEMERVSGREAFVRVRRPDGRVVHRHREPVQIAPGRHRLVEVAVDRAAAQPGSPTKAGAERAPREHTGEKVPPLEDIKGIGPQRAKDLRAAGIQNAKDFAEADEGKLEEILNYDVGRIKERNEALFHRARQASSTQR